MLKYIKNHMSSIEGIEIYPLISLSIFFIFFTLLFYHVFRGGKDRFKSVENYPVDENEQQF